MTGEELGRTGRRDRELGFRVKGMELGGVWTGTATYSCRGWLHEANYVKETGGRMGQMAGGSRARR